MTVALPAYTLIETDEALHDLAEHLQREPLLAVDTESNNRYAYQPRVCLIQLSTRAMDYIIDPLPVVDLSPVGELFADEAIEKVFHAAEYDLICLQRDFGFVVRNLFDTMYAARLLRIYPFGLGNVLAQFFDVAVDKSHQLDDWGRRPLDADSLRYAQKDTHYLPALRDLLLDELLAQDRLSEAREVFADVTRFEIKDRAFDPDGFWNIGRPNQLSQREMGVLSAVYRLREQMANEIDEPALMVISNTGLVEIARRMPTTESELAALDVVRADLLAAYSGSLVEAVREGCRARLSAPPKVPRPNPRHSKRYVALHEWRKREAQRRNLDASLILPKQTLWQLAQVQPRTLDDVQQIEGIGPWRAAHYGPEIVKILRQVR